MLDEADRLLESSFEDDLGVIFDCLPAKRQTLFFSATLSGTLARLREVTTSKPHYWEETSGAATTVEELDQRYVLMPAKVSVLLLVSL